MMDATLHSAIERGAEEIAFSDLSTKDDASCWLRLCEIGISLTGHHIRPDWFFDLVIARANEMRREWTMGVAA